jgi:hypothetical protein
MLVNVSAPEYPKLMFFLCLEERKNGKAMVLTTIELARP